MMQKVHLKNISLFFWPVSVRVELVVVSLRRIVSPMPWLFRALKAAWLPALTCAGQWLFPPF